MDTSVFGGCFDAGFRIQSRRLLAEIRAGRFCAVLSTTTLAEVSAAPPRVRAILANIPSSQVELVTLTDQVIRVRDAYLAARILGSASLRDAEHVAAATVARADLLVSWNFKHIVHFDKIAGFNEVNQRLGYGAIRIHAPPEVVL